MQYPVDVEGVRGRAVHAARQALGLGRFGHLRFHPAGLPGRTSVLGDGHFRDRHRSCVGWSSCPDFRRSASEWLALARADDMRVITSAATLVEVVHPRIDRPALEWTLSRQRHDPGEPSCHHTATPLSRVDDSAPQQPLPLSPRPASVQNPVPHQPREPCTASSTASNWNIRAGQRHPHYRHRQPGRPPAQRIQSVQAKLTPRHPKMNVSAGQKPAQVGRVGLEPTADGL